MNNDFLKTIPRLFAFDTETTGLDPKEERIVELGYILYVYGVETERKALRFNPGKPIPPVVSRIHGIHDIDVKDCPAFSELAESIRALMTEDTVYMGFNIEFDLKFLKHEFKRAKVKELTWNNNTIIDPLKVMRNTVINNKLTTLYKAFVGKPLEAAHTADGDIAATVELMHHMVKALKLDPNYKSLAEICYPKDSSKTNRVIGGDKFIWGKKGEVLINFGKYRGKELAKTAKSDSQYLGWFLGTTKEHDEKQLVQDALDGNKLPEMKVRK